MSGRSFIVLVLGLSLLGAGALGTAGAADYELSVSNTIETPTRTVSIGTEEFEVSSVSTIELGNTLDVETTVPAGDRHLVSIYEFDDDRDIVESGSETGSGTISFDITKSKTPNHYTLGTYTIALSHDGDFKEIQPLVVQGFDLTVSAPDSGYTNESITVSVDAVRTVSGKSIDRVEVAVINDSDSLTETATNTGGNKYEATVPVSDLSPGEYRIYTAVRGTKNVDGRNERLAVSDASTFELSTPPTPTPTPTPTPNSTEIETETQSETETDSDEEQQAAGGVGGGAAGIGRVNTDEPTSTPESTPATEQASSTGVSSQTSPEGVQQNSPADSPDSGSRTEADGGNADQPGATADSTRAEPTGTPGNVITPASTDRPMTEGTPTEAPSQPGFGLVVGVIAMVLAMVLSLRRRD